MKLADNKATLSFSNGSPSVDLPVYQGSIGPDVIDIRRLYSDAGVFTFTVGTGVIQGFSRGVTGMRVGGQRRVVIPPDLGYGSAGAPPAIPGNATLVFDIELRAIQ